MQIFSDYFNKYIHDPHMYMVGLKIFYSKAIKNVNQKNCTYLKCLFHIIFIQTYRPFKSNSASSI